MERSHLVEVGFDTVSLLQAETIVELKDLLDSLNLPANHGFFASSNDLDAEPAGIVARRITELVAPALARVLPDHEPFLASFLTKGSEQGSTVSFHQDLTYTDERTSRTIMVWVPLCDVDARNGAMAVVPRSHRWTSGTRPGGEHAIPTEPHQLALTELARVVPLQAGEALLYDAAIVHGSGDNPTAFSRPAIGIAMVPKGTELVHVHRQDDGTLSAWSVDADFYTSQSLRSRPNGCPETEIWALPVDEKVFDDALGRAVAEEPQRRGNAVALRVLADPAADEALRRDGFAVIDFSEAVDLAEQLTTFYAEVHGLGGQGFEPDLVNPDRKYRLQVSDRLEAAFDALSSDRFIDYEPFLRVFLAKWPGPDSDLYLHRDWMYVDEQSSGHTYVVWIPLCDVDEVNGPLRVLPGSHLLDDSHRGTDLNAPWINHHDVVVPRLRTVTTRLGQAVVLDNALVHASLPNLSDELRLVAAVGLKPMDAPMVHFLRADNDTVWRYDVDETFLLSTTPQELLESPPEMPVVERLAAGQRFWTEEQLLVALGEEPRPTETSTPAPEHNGWWHRARSLIGRR